LLLKCILTFYCPAAIFGQGLEVRFCTPRQAPLLSITVPFSSSRLLAILSLTLLLENNVYLFASCSPIQELSFAPKTSKYFGSFLFFGTRKVAGGGFCGV
jgi:hypothetical protein